MPVRDQYYGGSVEKQWVRIVTVDTRTRRIDAQFKDYGVVQISLYEVPGGFRWPIEGELWMVVRENSEWYLRSPAQSLDTKYPIEDLDQGDTLIGEESAKISMIGLVRAREVVVGSDTTTGPDVVTGVEAVTSEGYVGIGGHLEVVGRITVDGYVSATDYWRRGHLLKSTDLDDSANLVHGEDFTVGQIAKRTATGWAPVTGADLQSTMATPFETTITGDGSTSLFTVTHNLGSRDVFVSIRESLSPAEHVQARIKSPTVNAITIETLPPLGNGVIYNVVVARALGGATAAPSSPTAHSTSHKASGSDPLPLFDVQHMEGADENYHSFSATQPLMTDAANTIPLRISYTPTVDAWWEIFLNIGIIQKTDAAYHYTYSMLYLVAGTTPATAGYTTMVVGDILSHQIHTQRSDVQQYGSRGQHKIIPLTAGVPYTIGAQLFPSAGTWQYYKGRQHLYLQGKAWAR